MNYDRIYPCDMVNGPGCRVVLFVTGCLHKCNGCYNKSTWNPKNGKEFNEKTVDTIIRLMSHDYISGITLTGGDPFYPDNRNDIMNLACNLKTIYPNKSIWAWTGYRIEQLDNTLLKNIDVIIDSKFEESNPTDKLYRGSDNQRRWEKKSNIWHLID